MNVAFVIRPTPICLSPNTPPPPPHPETSKPPHTKPSTLNLETPKLETLKPLNPKPLNQVQASTRGLGVAGCVRMLVRLKVWGIGCRVLGFRGLEFRALGRVVV